MTHLDRHEAANRLAEIEHDIAESKGVITEDQEAEIATIIGKRAEDAIQVSLAFGRKAELLSQRIQEAKLFLGLLEERKDFYRAKARGIMEGLGLKSLKSDTESWSASLVQGKGRVVPLVEPKDMPDEFRREVVTYKVETDLVRMALEMGRVPETDDGRPIAELVREPHLRIVQDKALSLGDELRELSKR